MAVIAALLVVAAAASIAAALLDRQSTQARLLQSEQARAQARWLLIGGIDWARVILRADGRRSATTRNDQAWATPIVDMRVSQEGDADAAVFSGRIEDEQGKFNLQNLARNGQVEPLQLAALTRLLEVLRLPSDAAPRIARRIADGQARTGGGNAASASSSGMPGSAPAPGLQSVADLRGIGSLDDEAVRRLRCCVTVLPAHTAVNVNTAPSEVLHAAVAGLSLAQAMAMVGERDRGRYFNDGRDFANRLADPEIEIPHDTLAATSRWFGLAGAVRLGRATVAMHALLQRDDQQSTHIVWMTESN